MPRCADRKLNRGCDCGPHAEPLLGAALLEPFHLGETGLAARRIERSMAAWVVSTTSSPESAALDGRHSSRAAGWSAWHVAQAVLGYACESHWLRAARRRPGHLFPHPRKQSGYIKRGFAQRCPWSNALSGTWRGIATCGSTRPGSRTDPGAPREPARTRARTCSAASCRLRLRLLHLTHPVFQGPAPVLVCTPTGMPIMGAPTQTDLHRLTPTPAPYAGPAPRASPGPRSGRRR